MAKKPYKVDLPVLLVFFVRDEPLKRVFDRIREARPSKLYLCQDGPRKNRPDDIIQIQKCRDIVSHIDWTCQVFTNFAQENQGCDPNIYRGLKWIFSHEDRMLMLEDDAIPDLTFFRFCAEMLERYQFDTRIHTISSLNLTERWDPCPYDYFFSYTHTLSGGWASWKRCWEERSETLELIDNSYATHLFRQHYHPRYSANYELILYRKRQQQILKTGRIMSFEAMLTYGMAFQHQLSIVPTRNMLNNIGLTAEATHGTINPRHLPKPIRKIFFMSCYAMPEKIKHPQFVLPDKDYYIQVGKILGWHPIKSLWRKLEGRLRRIFIK